MPENARTPVQKAPLKYKALDREQVCINIARRRVSALLAETFSTCYKCGHGRCRLLAQAVALDTIGSLQRAGFDSPPSVFSILQHGDLPMADKRAAVADAQRQVASRWTPRIASAGWTPVSDVFLRNYHRLRITHGEAMVVIHIFSFKWDASAPFPALKTIARRMGISAPSVRTHLRSLERKGFLTRQIRTGTTNRFHLQGLFLALESLMERDELDAAHVESADAEDEALVA
jgi:Helix-turn-helix domain